MAPAKIIKFDNNTFCYFRNKHNVLLYKGRSPRANYKEVLLVVQHDPEKNTYYILFMIEHKIVWSGWSDVDDDEFFETIKLDGVNRMATPVK